MVHGWVCVDFLHFSTSAFLVTDKVQGVMVSVFSVQSFCQCGFKSMGCQLGFSVEYFPFFLQKILCRSKIPLLLTLQLDLSSVTVANLGWQRERWLERKESGGKKRTKQKTVYPPKKLLSKFAGIILFPRGGCSLPVLPRGVWTEGAAAICVLV